jgi:hypothetical protein
MKAGLSGYNKGEHKKRLRKQLGDDEVVINLKSVKPYTFQVRVLNLISKKILAEKTFIMKGNSGVLSLNLPYEDMVLGVHVKSLGGEQDFYSKIYMKSDRIYQSMTGQAPLSIEKYFKGGGGLAQQPDSSAGESGFLKQADSDFLVTQTDGSYIIYNS